MARKEMEKEKEGFIPKKCQDFDPNPRYHTRKLTLPSPKTYLSDLTIDMEHLEDIRIHVQ